MSAADLRFSLELGARALLALRRAGVIAPMGPRRLAGVIRALGLGLGPHTLVAANAARRPDHPAVADERGALSYLELHQRAGALAAALRDGYGVGPGRGLAVMCRNHRGFLEGVLAGSRLGADLLLLNTDFPAPQLARVLERGRPALVVHDAEFAPLFEEAGSGAPRIVAEELDRLIARGGRPPGRVKEPGRFVILTSGTTGVPKSAPRTPELRAVLGPMTTLLSNLPLRVAEPMLVAPPFFHGFGLAYLSLGLMLGSTLVMRRRFDAEGTLAAIAEHGVATLVVVPVMLQRILALPEEARAAYDTSSLRTVASAGAALPPAVSSAFMDAFGEVVYNLYGSTETGFGGVAGPADLREAPGTVGRPPYGTRLAILGEDRRELPPGEVGHVFLGGPLVFEGYAGEEEDKEVVDGLMNTGDLGHLDPSGRLHIDGREDDMIVSGGENVFPQEVADVLGRHEGVGDVAVVGVEDEEFGQRLRAYVVPAPGAEPAEEELRAYVKERLARYQVPREVVFVDEVPRNPTGKVLKAELESRLR